MTLALLLALTASAQERGSWGDLHDALLVESADGDAATAQLVYQRLVRELPTADPIRAEALYWLARSRWLAGQTDEARDAVLEGIRLGICRDRCRDLLERIELDASAVTRVPVAWDFESPDHSLFHPWRYDDKGNLRLGRPTTGPDEKRQDGVLIWSTTIDLRSEDQLVLAFENPQPAPTEIEFAIMASRVPATIRVFAEDQTGRTYTQSNSWIDVPVGVWVFPLTIWLDRMVAIDNARDTLDPALLSRLRLVDTTGTEGRGSGPNELYIDDFAIR